MGRTCSCLAVCLDKAFREPRINDSKLLTPMTRAKIFTNRKKPGWSVGQAEVGEIDEMNILKATHRAMKRALKTLLASHPAIGRGAGGRTAGAGRGTSAIHCEGDAKSASIAAY